MKLTKQQSIALDRLRASQPFTVTPARTLIERRSGRKIAIPTIIETGINTSTLHGLRDAGLIKCEHLWLRGHVSPDLEII